MNIKALIKKYEAVECVVGIVSGKTILKTVLRDLQQLDEPEKVKVPQCVHKYIQEAKEYNWDLQDLIKSIDDEDSEELQRWFYHECNQETLARAWLDGYEVEEEKRYLVKLKNNSEEIDYLVDTKTNGYRFFSNLYTQRREHTRKELEDADFGWVFDCPGIEIEEME
ncbi:DUF1642 domain-containing protein [Streptococcus pneumoniae]|uniref:DUF1642 domain-containing protein n=1 Tax=Streptococcus pseudopneumoniae TaxID=257758 RepID=UPI003127CD11